MKQRLKILFVTWALLLALMVIQKPLFMLLQPAYGGADFASLGAVMRHGLAMDLSMSAYLVAPVVLLLIASVWTQRRWVLSTLKIYFGFISFIIAAVAVVDAILYPYWNFRLDSLPLFYFMSSPAAAMASLDWWWELAAVIVVAVLSIAIYQLLALTLRMWRDADSCRHRVAATAVMAVIAGLLIIPIRGGVTVSTMAPGRAFFSTDMRLNHAALNPVFTLMYSLMHSANPSAGFQFFEADEAMAAAQAVAGNSKSARNDSIGLRVEQPDVYLIILESFSNHLLPSLGGEPVAPQLDSLARQSVVFSNFYAESFRTDRALASILGGYPSMPSVSPLKYANKFGGMPSLSAELARHGYATEYYYGGDINFTNLNAFLVSTGFGRIVSDTDFPVSERLSKWGVHDHLVYRKVLEDPSLRDHGARPALRVIQTSSSHEPFDVPYSRLADKRANAFAYADSCLGDFIRRLSALPRWDRSLVVIVPDHWGGYPQGLTDPVERHRVPLVLTGGALRGAPAVISTPASQSGIAPTVLSLLGYDRSMFPFSRDMLSPDMQGQFAWFSEPEWMCLLLPGQDKPAQVMTDPTAPALTQYAGDKGSEKNVKAFAQSVYSDFDRR